MMMKNGIVKILGLQPSPRIGTSVICAREARGWTRAFCGAGQQRVPGAGQRVADRCRRQSGGCGGKGGVPRRQAQRSSRPTDGEL